MKNLFFKIFSTRVIPVSGLVVVAVLSGCGSDDDDSLSLNLEHLTDVEGNVYVAVFIDSQVWMAENLKRWHMPSDAEGSTSIDLLGGEDVVGGPLKEITTAHWSAPGATNEAGFSAVPAGYLCDNSTYYSLGNVTHLEFHRTDADSAWDRYVTYKDRKALKGEYSKQVFYSCRCIKN